MKYASILVLGILLSVLGIINIRGNISTIHYYNRRKVREEDVPKYAKAVGTGTLIIGLSFICSFLVSFLSELLIPFVCVPAVIVGLAFILYAQFRYNKGLF